MKTKRIKTNLTAIIILIAIVGTLLFIGYSGGKSKYQRLAYERNKYEYSVYVCGGDTLWDIAEQYKPYWVNTREMVAQIKKDNHLTSNTIMPGDMLTIYTDKQPIYELQGYYADGVVYTADGHKWGFNSEDEYLNNSDVLLTIYNNGTNELYDDIIIKVEEI